MDCIVKINLSHKAAGCACERESRIKKYEHTWGMFGLRAKLDEIWPSIVLGRHRQVCCLLGWAWPPRFLFVTMDEAARFFIWLDILTMVRLPHVYIGTYPVHMIN
jgi:hypothetical protein